MWWLNSLQKCERHIRLYNPTLSAKIDEDNSSCRYPLKVMKDCLTDKKWMENVTKEQLDLLQEKASSKFEGSAPFYAHLGQGKTKEDI